MFLLSGLEAACPSLLTHLRAFSIPVLQTVNNSPVHSGLNSYCMKKLLFAVLILMSYVSFAQTTGYFRYDSVRIQRGGGNATLIIENATRNVTNGFLQNYGEGRTRFARALDSVWVDGDSLRFRYGLTTIAVLAPGGGPSFGFFNDETNSGGSTTKDADGQNFTLTGADTLTLGFNELVLSSISSGEIDENTEFVMRSTDNGRVFTASANSFLFGLGDAVMFENREVDIQDNDFRFISSVGGYGFFPDYKFTPGSVSFSFSGDGVYTTTDYVFNGNSVLMTFQKEDTVSGMYIDATNYDNININLLATGKILIQSDSVLLNRIQTVSDTTSRKPLIIDDDGYVYRLDHWPGSGSGDTPTLDEVTAAGNTSTSQIIVETDVADNSVVSAFTARRKRTSGTPGNGIGTAITFEAPVNIGVAAKTNEIQSYWQDATVGTRSARMLIRGVRNGSESDWFALDGQYAYLYTGVTDTLATRKWVRDNFSGGSVEYGNGILELGDSPFGLTKPNDSTYAIDTADADLQEWIEGLVPQGSSVTLTDDPTALVADYAMGIDTSSRKRPFVKILNVVYWLPIADSTIILTALGVPNNFTATMVDHESIDLDWEDVENEIGYLIYRNTTSDFGTATLIHTAAANATSYTDTGLDAETQYFYWIIAQGDGENYSNSYSTMADATTDEDPSFDADSEAYLDRVAAHGVTITSTDRERFSTLFETLKADGTYTIPLDMYFFGWSNADANAEPLKAVNPDITWVNSSTHASTGVTGNGTNSYGNTSVAANVLTLNNTHLCVYTRTSPTQSVAEIGARGSAATSRFEIQTRTSGNTLSYMNSNTAGVSVSTATNGIGMFVSTRTSSTDFRVFRNGTQVGSTATTTNDGTMPTGNIYILATNSNGSASLHSGREVIMASFGSSFTPTQAANYTTAWNALITAYGLNTF